MTPTRSHQEEENVRNVLGRTDLIEQAGARHARRPEHKMPGDHGADPEKGTIFVAVMTTMAVRWCLSGSRSGNSQIRIEATMIAITDIRQWL
jgi:hypothetical protein